MKKTSIKNQDQLVNMIKRKRLHKNVGRVYNLPLIVVKNKKFAEEIFTVKIFTDHVTINGKIVSLKK